MAWKAVMRLLWVARRVKRYIAVQIGAAEVAMRVEVRTCMGPLMWS